MEYQVNTKKKKKKSKSIVKVDKSLINLQNVPRDEYTRSCFISEEGNILISCDYDSEEVRVFTNQCLDENMIKMFHSGYTDAHSYNAWHIFKEIRANYPEMNLEILSNIKKEFPKLRYLAKTGIFALQFGGSGSTISRNCDVSLKEGEEFETNYFKAFPTVKKYFDRVYAEAKKLGYILYNNTTKRKYFINENLPDYKIKNYSRNYCTQGSAADISKLGGILFYRKIKQYKLLYKVLIVNFIHDEYLIECPESMSKVIALHLRDSMQLAGQRFYDIVPLTATPEINLFWKH